MCSCTRIAVAVGPRGVKWYRCSCEGTRIRNTNPLFKSLFLRDPHFTEWRSLRFRWAGASAVAGLRVGVGHSPRAQRALYPRWHPLRGACACPCCGHCPQDAASVGSELTPSFPRVPPLPTSLGVGPHTPCRCVTRSPPGRSVAHLRSQTS